jgi:hypothetical protein
MRYLTPEEMSEAAAMVTATSSIRRENRRDFMPS